MRGKYWWIFLEKLSWASEHVVLPLFTYPSISILSQHPVPQSTEVRTVFCVLLRYVHSTNIVCGTQLAINMSVELLKQWYLSPDS